MFDCRHWNRTEMDRCRACLSTNRVGMIDLNEDFIGNYNLLTNLSITSVDGMPQKLCINCSDAVQQYITFRNKCIYSDSLLRKRVTDIKSEKSSIQIELLDIKKEDECVVKEELMDINEYREVDSLEVLADCFEDSVPSDFEDDYKLLYIVKDNVDELNVTKAEKPKKRKSSRLLKKTTKDIEGDGKNINNSAGLQLIDADNSKKGIIPCGLCPKEFESKSLLSAHLENHKSDVSCQYCFEGFLDLSHILSHRLRHIPLNHAACPVCWKRFRRDFYLEYHIRTTHCEDKFQGLQCKICLRKYDTPIRLKKHVNVSHSGKLFICNVCSKPCKSKSLLKSHLRVHSSEKKYICDLCGYSCKFSGTLKDHKLRKHSLEKFECKHCSRMFDRQQLMAKHSCKQLYMCAICGKEFKQRGSYKRHMQSHSEERRYECARCPAKYKSKGALQVHTDRHDGVRSKQCEYCPAKFYSASVLIKHRRVHTGEKPYVCKVCKKGFTGRHNLKVHMKVHGEMLIVKKNVDPELPL